MSTKPKRPQLPGYALEFLQLKLGREVVFKEPAPEPDTELDLNVSLPPLFPVFEADFPKAVAVVDTEEQLQEVKAKIDSGELRSDTRDMFIDAVTPLLTNAGDAPWAVTIRDIVAKNLTLKDISREITEEFAQQRWAERAEIERIVAELYERAAGSHDGIRSNP